MTKYQLLLKIPRHGKIPIVNKKPKPNLNKDNESKNLENDKKPKKQLNSVVLSKKDNYILNGTQNCCRVIVKDFTPASNGVYPLA